jgi:hypothetical protein
VAVLQRFVVTQDYDEIWWVRDEGAFNLYCYPSEEEARTAALALAKNATENGAAATVLINPSIRDSHVEVEDTRKPPRRFTGM